MNPFERQLSALLAKAPGEPPVLIDVDALLARRRRRRLTAPALAAAAVVVIAAPAAILLSRIPVRSPTEPATRFSTSAPIADPRAAAIREAQVILEAAAVLPHAEQLRRPPVTALQHPDSTPGTQHVQLTRFWTAPGSVGAALSYLRAHPPEAMQASGSAAGGGPDGPAVQTLFFAKDPLASLQYQAIAYRGGVAVRADAQVLWAPARSPADTVPSSVTSVDVVIVRTGPQRHQGAPTVRRTLTGHSAAQLADAVNRLPRAVPGTYLCPSASGRKYDQLEFHSSGPSARVTVDMTGCRTITVRIGQRPPIQLSGQLDPTVLASVGLPPNYGGGR